MGIGSVVKILKHTCAVPSVTAVGPHQVPHVFTAETSSFSSDPVGRPYVDFTINNSAHLGHPIFRPKRRVPEWKEYPGMFYDYGTIAEERGSHDIAALFYSWERSPGFIAPAYNSLAAIHFKQGRFEEAIQWFSRALEVEPDCSEIALNLGKCYVNSGRHEEAIPYFERYLASDPENGDAHFFRAYALDEAGRLDEAAPSYEDAIRFSNDPDIRLNAYYNLGVVHETMGRTDKAVDAYWEVLNIDPDNAEAHYNLGTIAFDLDMMEEAEGLFEVAVSQRPDDVDSRYALGVSYFTRGRYTHAVEQFERLLSLDRADVRAQVYLGLISFFTKQWGDAEQWFGASYKRFRADSDFKKAEAVEVMLLLARAGSYDKKREWAAARACLQSAADKLELKGSLKLAGQIRYICAYKGEQLRLSDVIGDVSGELLKDFMEDVGLGGSLGVYAAFRKEKESELRRAYLESGSTERFKTKAAEVIAATRAMGGDIKRKAIELFRQYELLHRHTPLGLPPERQKYPASRFFSGLIGDVFYNEGIRDEVEGRLGIKPAKLSAGINYFEAPKALLSKLRQSLDEYYQDYSHPFGGGNVRKAIADYENALAGSTVYTKDNVAVTLGATGAIFVAFKFLEKLRERAGSPMDVLIPSPTYYVYGATAVHLGFGVEEIVNAATDDHRFLPTPAEIELRMQQNGNIGMIALANPNNPTGEIYSPDELREIVAIAKWHGAYILYDEIFSDLMLTDDPLPAIGDLAQEQGYLDHVMKVTSWSKDRCIPGFRVGYLVADRGVLSTISELPEWQYANPPTILNGVIERDLTYRQMMEHGQDGDTDFEDYKADLQRNRARYQENLHIVRERLSDTRRFTILEPKAAFNMFVRINGMEGYDQWDFAEKLFVEKGVEVHPGPGFGLEQHDWETKHGLWIRISFAIEREELERGLDGLLEFVEECRSDPEKIKK